jgi:hypothetical protein
MKEGPSGSANGFRSLSHRKLLGSKVMMVSHMLGRRKGGTYPLPHRYDGHFGVRRR